MKPRERETGSASPRRTSPAPPRRGYFGSVLKIDRGEGRGRSQNCNNKTPQKGPRPYSSSTTEALARERTRGSVGLSSRPSGLFFPVDLREERHRAETDTATTALRRFDVASTAPAGTPLSLAGGRGRRGRGEDQGDEAPARYFRHRRRVLLSDGGRTRLRLAAKIAASL